MHQLLGWTHRIDLATAQPQEVFDVARRSRERTGRDIDGVPAQLSGTSRDGQHRVGAQPGVVHDPAGGLLSDGYVKSVLDVCKVGDKLDVKVIAVDEQDRVKLSRKAAMREMASTEGNGAPAAT